MSSEFWKWFDAMAEKAKASPAGKVLTAAGFEPMHTGGNCLAWHKAAATSYVYITQGDCELGEDVTDPEAAEWMACIYATIDNANGHYVETTSLADAIQWAALALANPARYLTETPHKEWLAERFAAILKEWLTAEQWADMKRKNETDPRYTGGVCASHDYCDANMAMDQAWRERFATSPNADDEAQATLWSTAWDLAKERHLGKPQRSA